VRATTCTVFQQASREERGIEGLSTGVRKRGRGVRGGDGEEDAKNRRVEAWTAAVRGGEGASARKEGREESCDEAASASGPRASGEAGHGCPMLISEPSETSLLTIQCFSKPSWRPSGLKLNATIRGSGSERWAVPGSERVHVVRGQQFKRMGRILFDGHNVGCQWPLRPAHKARV